MGRGRSDLWVIGGGGSIYHTHFITPACTWYIHAGMSMEDEEMLLELQQLLRSVAVSSM